MVMAMAKKTFEGQVATVVGVGLIGGSLCYALKREGLAVRGVSKRETLEKAADRGAIDEGFEYSEVRESLKGAHFIFLCTPLQDIIKRLQDILEWADKGSIVTDVGSTKERICREAERVSTGVIFIGGHPMTGSEKRGFENANPFLFYDAVYVLTPLARTPKRALKTLSRLLSSFGAKVMVIDPQLHDDIAANVSHLPQLLAILLVNQLGKRKSDIYRSLAAGGFRDMTRIASSDYTVWADIISTNMGEIKKALVEFRDDINYLIDNLDHSEYLERLFRLANSERKKIPRYSKGFIAPLVDIRVNVKDRPGELARITGIIFYAGINIKDIEIVNIREGEGGILRLGFVQKEDAEKASRALKIFGYEVQIVE